jgi:Kae1-associated kinase Bud32
MKILNEGAEAQIFQIDNIVLKKVRIQKNYRLKEIDLNLRKHRNRVEFKILTKLYENKVLVPKPIDFFENENDFSFTFEKIEGEELNKNLDKKKLKKTFLEIIKMHNLDIVHFDLTTKNMIYNNKNQNIYLIDFGLSFHSKKIEEKAVDLNLFFNCLKNEDKKLYLQKNKLLKLYKKKTELGEKIIEQLKNVENRGRNKVKKKLSEILWKK